MRISKLKSASFLIVLGLGFSSASVWAQELKVAFVDVQKIMSQAPKANAARDRLKKEGTEKEKKLLAMQSELQTLREKYNRDSLTMKESERKDMELKMIRLERELKWNQTNYEEDLKIMRNDLLKDVQADIYKTIVKIAQDKKYDLILSDGVLFGSSRVDLTIEVIDTLKQQSTPAK